MFVSMVTSLLAKTKKLRLKTEDKNSLFTYLCIMYSLKFFNVTSLLSINKTILCIFMTLDFKKIKRF